MRLSRRMVINSSGGGTDVKVSYTGNYTDTIITSGGVQRRLLTFTSSGTLTLDKKIEAEVWLCNGGMAGSQGYTASSGWTSYRGSGGRGADFRPETEVTVGTAPIVVTIGAGGQGFYYNWTGDKTLVGGSTTFGSYGATTIGSGAGQGGADARTPTLTSGGGVSTVPFGYTVHFSPHCAGGGGGGYYSNASKSGGHGGSDGGNGNLRGNSDIVNSYYGGTGGEKGGGNGGSSNATISKGTAGTFYGAGGGGGNHVDSSDGYSGQGAGGNGYQGVVYLLI